MKHISDFISFDYDSWVKGKEFTVKAIYDRKDKETQEKTGYNVRCVITKDECKTYKRRDGEEFFSLIGEEVYFSTDNTNATIGSKVKPESVTANVSVKKLQNGSAFLTVYFNCKNVNKI